MPYEAEDLQAIYNQEFNDTLAELEQMLRGIVNGGTPHEIEATIEALKNAMTPLVDRNSSNFRDKLMFKLKSEELEKELIQFRDQGQSQGENLPAAEWPPSNNPIQVMDLPGVTLNFISDTVMKTAESKITNWIGDEETSGADVAEWILRLVSAHRS